MVAKKETLNDTLHRISERFVRRVWEVTTSEARKWSHANAGFRKRRMEKVLDDLRKELQLRLVEEFGYLAMEVGAKAKALYSAESKDSETQSKDEGNV